MIRKSSTWVVILRLCSPMAVRNVAMTILMLSGPVMVDAGVHEEIAAAGSRDFTRHPTLDSFAEPPTVTPIQVVPMGKGFTGGVPDNFAQLPDGRVFRGAELKNRQQYSYLKQILNIDIVVNMKEAPDDPQACKVNGLECVQFPIKLFWPFVTNIDWETLREAFYFVLEAQRRGKAVYFHCRYGSDRTGALAAALRVRREACRVRFDKDVLWGHVDADLKRHGFHEVWFPSLRRDIKNLIYDFKRNESWLCR